jgi:hypothetical protein
MGGKAEPGELRAVADLPINHTGNIGARARFGQQRHSEPSAYQAFEIPTTDVVTHDLGPVSGRSQFRNQQILKLRSGIAPAQQEPLVPKVDPIDRFLGSS